MVLLAFAKSHMRQARIHSSLSSAIAMSAPKARNREDHDQLRG